MAKIESFDAPLLPLVEPDAHGQAALLLTESLLHALVASAVLSNGQAVEVIEIAAEVKVEVATAHHESRKRIDESLKLLADMQASFESDEVRRR